jgi:isoleucyl-tRNA synthetase
MAPILCFTAEEVWQSLEGRGEKGQLTGSVHTAGFPEPLSLAPDAELVARWDRLFEVREEVLKALEISRAAGRIGNSLEAAVDLQAGDDLRPFLQTHAALLPTVFIVSRAGIADVGEPTLESVRLPGLRVGIRRAEGAKCERCWNVRTDVGADHALPTLCGRCAPTVAALAKARSAAG